MKHIRAQAGFTLLEMVIATTFLATAVGAISSVLIGINKINQQSYNLATATQLAQKKLEGYRNVPYVTIALSPPATDFTAEMPASLGSPRSATATVTQAEDGLKQIDIAISYTEAKVTKNLKLTTLIAVRGINR